MADQPEVFTKAFKARGNIVVALVLLGMFIVPMAIAFGLGAWVGRAWSETAGIAIIFGGIAVTAGLHFTVGLQQVPLLYNEGLRRDIAAALERRHERVLDDGASCFVGWSPGSGVNPKDGETDHDVGFLSLTPEVLTYTGDTVRFELYRSQVHSVEARQDGVPIVMDFGKRIRVHRVDQYRQLQCFTLERREGKTKREVRKNNTQLAEVLQHWHYYGTVAGDGEGPACTGEGAGAT